MIEHQVSEKPFVTTKTNAINHYEKDADIDPIINYVYNE